MPLPGRAHPSRPPEPDPWLPLRDSILRPPPLLRPLQHIPGVRLHRHALRTLLRPLPGKRVPPRSLPGHRDLVRDRPALPKQERPEALLGDSPRPAGTKRPVCAVPQVRKIAQKQGNFVKYFLFKYRPSVAMDPRDQSSPARLFPGDTATRYVVSDRPRGPVSFWVIQALEYGALNVALSAVLLVVWAAAAARRCCGRKVGKNKTRNWCKIRWHIFRKLFVTGEGRQGFSLVRSSHAGMNFFQLCKQSGKKPFCSFPWPSLT